VRRCRACSSGACARYPSPTRRAPQVMPVAGRSPGCKPKGSAWRSPHELAVDRFVTCKLVPARPGSGKLSVLRRPDLNKLAAGQPRSAAAITVINACAINACALGRAGEASKGRGQYLCPPEPGDVLRQLDADGSSRSSADRQRTGRPCASVGESAAEVPAATFARPGILAGIDALGGRAAVRAPAHRPPPGCRRP
jgi:hypothetical protein